MVESYQSSSIESHTWRWIRLDSRLPGANEWGTGPTVSVLRWHGRGQFEVVAARFVRSRCRDYIHHVAVVGVVDGRSSGHSAEMSNGNRFSCCHLTNCPPWNTVPGEISVYLNEWFCNWIISKITLSGSCAHGNSTIQQFGSIWSYARSPSGYQ